MKPGTSSSKYCLIRYVDYSQQNLPSIRQILKSIFGSVKPFTLKYKQTLLTKQNAGVYSHGMRHRYSFSQHHFKLQIVQKYQGYLCYQYKSSACQSDPIQLLKQVGYKEQAKYDIQQQVWKSDKYQVSVHLHSKFNLIEIRQETNKPIPIQFSYVEKIINKLKGNVKLTDEFSEQCFRPDKMDVIMNKKN